MNYRCEKAAQWVIWGFDYYLTTKVTKSHLFRGKVTPRTRGQNPGNSPFLHHKQGNCNLNVSLVRTRSPVQIWLAAPKSLEFRFRGFFIDCIDKNRLISFCKCLTKMLKSTLNQGFFAYFCLSFYISV